MSDTTIASTTSISPSPATTGFWVGFKAELTTIEQDVVTGIKNMANYVDNLYVSDIQPIISNAEQTVEAAAAAAWQSVEASFDADLPVLEGQAMALLAAFLTSGEAGLVALLPADAGIDAVAAKTALTKAVTAGAASLNAPQSA